MSLPVEQYKEDIANKYLENFKKELNIFEKAMILPINKKMKEILKSDKKIDVDNLSELEDLGFWRKVLWLKIWDKQLFDRLVTKVFNFLKEKQESIIQAEARWWLEDLLNSIINWKIENLSDQIDWNDWEASGNEEWSWEGESSWWENHNDGDDAENPDDVWTSESNRTNESNTENEWSQSVESQENQTNPIAAWIETWIWWAAAYYWWISFVENRLWINALRNVPEEFDKEQTKKMMKNISNKMQEKLDSWVKMNRAQRKTYEKSIKQFNEAAKSLDSESADAFRAWQNLSDRLPPNFLDDLKINKRILDLIDNLPDAELAKIIGKDEKFIVKFFSDKWISVSEDFAKQLKIVRNVSEIKQITKMARCGTKLSNVIKWIKWMWVITFLFMWFDAWCYVQSKNEAKLVEKINEERWKVLKDQATMQLYIWLGSVLIEALGIAWACMAWCSVTWPRWTAIWIAVWLIAAAAAIWYDNLYADKKSFYAQNRYDFINQRRTWIKQSIVQLLESDRLDMHEKMKSDLWDNRWVNWEINTMEDAREALIFQEECINWNFAILQRYYGSWEKEDMFLGKLVPEQVEQYKSEKKIMEELINKRMEYIKSYIKKDENSPEYKKMKEALNNKWWLKYIEQILADSKVYSYLKHDNEDFYIDNYKGLTVAGYKKAFKDKLSKEYNKEFTLFENLRAENPGLVREICKWVEDWSFSFEQYINGDESVEQVYTEKEIINLKKHIEFISRYYEYIKLWLSIESTPTLQSYTTMDQHYIESVLLDFNNINKRPQWSQKETLDYISSYEYVDREYDINKEVSNSVFQNILYSIAKEIHGYTWSNDKLELVAFYAWDWNNTWIYMNGKGKRKINEDWEIDWTINNPESLNKNNVLKKIVDQMELDSPVEAWDTSINIEFKKRVKEIVNREFEYTENKKKYEEKIIDFIKFNTQNKDSWYIELPQNLIVEWKKAWIGDLNKFIFKQHNGEIHALCRGDCSENVLKFDKINQKIVFEATTKLREEYTTEEESLIKMIDDIESKLLKIRWVEWDAALETKEDELDMPVELERILSKKSIEWSNIKESILYMKPYSAYDYFKENAKTYYNYFNWIYIWILSKITWKKNSAFTSNDLDDISDFFDIMSPIWEKVAYNESGKIKFGWFVDKKISEYMTKLLDEYKENNTWKTIKELLLSKDNEEVELWQELASELYKLCLEETTFIYSKRWLVDFSIRDMDDKKYETVKKKMWNILSGKKFVTIYKEYTDAEVPSVSNTSIRKIEHWEHRIHTEIEAITKKIITTLNNIDRAWKRKNPEFIPDERQDDEWRVSWVFKSRWYSENIIIEDNWNGILQVKIPGLNQAFQNIEEWIRVANLINFIKNNIKENPRWSKARLFWKLWNYTRKEWKLIRNVEKSMIDYVILKEDTVNIYYPSIKNSSEFINYINWFMK